MLTSVESRFDPILYPWVYLAKLLIVSGLLWIGRKAFPSWNRAGIVRAAIAGAAGTIVWVTLAPFTQLQLLLRFFSPSVLVSSRSAFDPFATIGSPLVAWTFVVVRLIGLAAVVPLMEELFWRGFLARYLIDPNVNRVPYGRFTLGSFTVVTLAFAAVHPELLAALVWGAGINLMLMGTRNLWSAIVMHAVTNLLLGIWIVTNARWTLW